MQYPQPPPLPTFAPTVATNGTTTSAFFDGTSDAAPLSGVTALIAWDNNVAETSIRIAVPKPGELTALSESVLSSVSYDGRSATGAATNPKLSQQADALAQAFLASPASVPYAFAPAGACRRPANPPSCKAATEAFVDSGVNGAVRRFAGQDATTHVAAKPEIVVYPKPADADRYRNYYGDLATCLADLYKSGLPAGSTVDVQRVPKRGTGSLPEELGGEDRRLRLDAQGCRRHPTGQDGHRGDHGAKPCRGSRRAARFTRHDADIKTELDRLERDLASVLSQK